MASDRHSYVRFYPSDWLAGTARLPRLHRSVYFDICCSIWDTALPCTALDVMMIVSDLPNGQAIVDELIALGKLQRNEDGSISNRRALEQAILSQNSRQAMIDGGLKGLASREASRVASGGLGHKLETRNQKPQPPKKGGARERGTKSRLPADFVPVLTEAAQANANRLGRTAYGTELQQFKDHHTAKASTMADWQAAFRTWLTNALKFQGGANERSAKPSGWL